MLSNDLECVKMSSYIIRPSKAYDFNYLTQIQNTTYGKIAQVQLEEMFTNAHKYTKIIIFTNPLRSGRI